jgi:hypothetical protein
MDGMFTELRDGGGEEEEEEGERESPYCLWPVVAPGSWILGIRETETCYCRLKGVWSPTFFAGLLSFHLQGPAGSRGSHF